jgi:hypothetical protein
VAVFSCTGERGASGGSPSPEVSVDGHGFGRAVRDVDELKQVAFEVDGQSSDGNILNSVGERFLVGGAPDSSAAG